MTGDAFHGFRAPERPDVREDGSRIGQQMTEQHGNAVEGVVFRSQHKSFAQSIPVKGRAKQGFTEVSVGQKVSPLTLSLKTSGNGVVTKGFLFESKCVQGRITCHQIPDDQGHLDHKFPVLIFLFPGTDLLRAIVINPFVNLAVFGGPGHGFFKFHRVVYTLFHASEDFHFINAFHPDTQVVLKEIVIHDGAGYTHALTAYSQVGLTPHHRHRQAGFDKPQDLGFHIGRYAGIGTVLHILSIDTKRR